MDADDFIKKLDRMLAKPEGAIKKQNSPKGFKKGKKLSNEYDGSNEGESKNNEKENKADAGKRWADIKALSKYIKYAEPTIREWVRLKKIPFHRPPGSRSIRFDLDEIDEWMKGRKKAVDK